MKGQIKGHIKRHIIVIVIVMATAMVAVLLVSCGNVSMERIRQLKLRHSEPERKALKVKVFSVDSLSNYSSFTYVGSIEEGASVPMSFVAGGTVTSVNVKNGQQVRKGQVLLTADNTTALSMLATARAKLAQAEDGFRRVKQVYDAGGVSEVKYMEVKTQLEEAHAAVVGLQKQVADCSLRAPIDGVVCNLEVAVGQNLLPNQQAMVIVNVKNLKVKISVAENKIGKMKVGDRGMALFPALGDLRIPCTIVEKGVIANDLTHSYDVRLALTSDSSAKALLPGMVAKVNMLSQSHDGFILPSYCIQNGHNEITVWVVKGGVATRRQIEIGSFVDDNVFITGGLNQGDSVVVSGYHKLFSGAKVEVER